MDQGVSSAETEVYQRQAEDRVREIEGRRTDGETVELQLRLALPGDQDVRAAIGSGLHAISAPTLRSKLGPI